MAEGRISDAERAKLRTLPVPGGNLDEEVMAWFEAGRALGDVERKRIQLSKDKDESSVSRSDVAKARARWVRAVNVALEMVEMARTLDDESRIRIIEPLRSAEAKADRARERDDERADESPDAPSPPEADAEETPAADPTG